MRPASRRTRRLRERYSRESQWEEGTWASDAAPLGLGVAPDESLDDTHAAMRYMSVSRHRGAARRLMFSLLMALPLTGALDHRAFGGSVINARGDAAFRFVETQRLTTGQPGVYDGLFGSAIAISRDGSTALVAAEQANDGRGVVWTFVRRGAGWEKETSPLAVPSLPQNAAFGSSVALSANGSTAVVGVRQDSDGGAWVFERHGAEWSPGTQLHFGRLGKKDAYIGGSVAISASGNTVLVGGVGTITSGPNRGFAGVGAAWVFTRVGTTWAQGRRLTPRDERGNGAFGGAVALSADGRTALVTAKNDVSGRGAAWVFGRTGSTWVQEGQKLVPDDEAGAGRFGSSASLSDDGTIALIGGDNDANARGAAWVFVRKGSTWHRQGAKLTGAGELGKGEFGLAVALSSDGRTAVIGCWEDNGLRGAVWAFARTSHGWTERDKLVLRDKKLDLFGEVIALSGDGRILFVSSASSGTALSPVFVFQQS